MFVTPIAVGLMFRFLLNQQLGAIPEILGQLGTTIDFFGPSLALPTIVAIDVWQWTPFMVLLLLAGLERPAAPAGGGCARRRRVDVDDVPACHGADAQAGDRDRRPAASRLDAFEIFEYVFATTNGGSGNAARNEIQLMIYRTGFGFFRLGEAAAMAFVLVAVVLIGVTASPRLHAPEGGGVDADHPPRLHRAHHRGWWCASGTCGWSLRG